MITSFAFNVNKLIESLYLLRTTAMYANGKFGLCKHTQIENRDDFSGYYQPEMLAMYLLRLFSFDQVEHIARRKNSRKAAKLTKKNKTALGVGNASSIGLCIFLYAIYHLRHNYFMILCLQVTFSIVFE